MKKALGICAISLALVSCKSSSQQTNRSTSANSNAAIVAGNYDAQLSQTLKELSSKAGGQVSIAVMHIETGKLSIVDGWAELHLFSVFKLPLAIAVLKNVEEGSLKLDQQVHIGPDELAVGTRANSLRW